MKRFSLRALLIGFVAVTLLLAWFREPIIRLVRSSQVDWELVETERDFDQMLSKEHSFVFVHADWSADSVIGRMAVEEFLVDWQWGGNSNVDFHLIDATDQDKEWVGRWMKSDQRLRFLRGGYGDAIWLRKGKLLERISGGQPISNADLKEKTQKHFVD